MNSDESDTMLITTDGEGGKGNPSGRAWVVCVPINKLPRCASINYRVIYIGMDLLRNQW